MADDESLDAETVFSWEILCDAAFEDHQGIWEPYWTLRGDGSTSYARDLNDHERQVASERALQRLWTMGYIRFFRVASGSMIDAAAEDPSATISDSEGPGLLTSRWWRRIPVPYADVYFTTTPVGDERANQVAEILRGLGEFSDMQSALPRRPDTSLARRHMEIGRMSQARDSLTGLLSHHGGSYRDITEVLTLLGRCEFERGDLASAGRFWCLTDLSGDEFDIAYAAFRKRCGDDPYQLWRQVSRLAFVRALPPIAASRVRGWASRCDRDRRHGWTPGLYQAAGDASALRWLQEVTKRWQGSWRSQRPIAHELRGGDHWVRFHSLPESKRYADDDAERSEVVRRHHAVLDKLREGDPNVVVFTAAWSDSPVAPTIPEVQAQLSRPILWTSVLRDVDDGDEYWTHVFVSREQVAAMDTLLLEVANADTADVIIAPPDLRWLYLPYDGGADVVVATTEQRNSLKSRFADWLSALPSGL